MSSLSLPRTEDNADSVRSLFTPAVARLTLLLFSCTKFVVCAIILAYMGCRSVSLAAATAAKDKS